MRTSLEIEEKPIFFFFFLLSKEESILELLEQGGIDWTVW